MASADDRRALLESIAFGDDPELRPADRLRALDLLGAFEPDGGPRGHAGLRAQFAAMSDTEIDALHDEMLAADLEQGPVAARMPLTAEVLERWVAERAEVRARELADADRLEREVERRAHELAERLYVQRGLGQLEAALAPPPPDGDADDDPGLDAYSGWDE